MTPYERLGISTEATDKEIKAAYRSAAQKLHPDKNDGGDPAEYIALQEAYAILSDPIAKAHYDQTGETAGNSRTEVEHRLAALFGFLIDNNCDSGNLVHAAEQAMAASTQRFTAELRKAEARIIRLRALRNRVVSTTTNAFNDLIDQRISSEIADIARLERELEINQLLNERLGDYSDNQGLPC